MIKLDGNNRDELGIRYYDYKSINPKAGQDEKIYATLRIDDTEFYGYGKDHNAAQLRIFEAVARKVALLKSWLDTPASRSEGEL